MDGRRYAHPLQNLWSGWSLHAVRQLIHRETTGADSTLPYEEDEDDVEEEDWLSSSSMTSLTRDLGLKLGTREKELLQRQWIEGSLLFHMTTTDAAEAKKKKNAGGGQKGRAALEKSSDSEDYFIRDGQDDTDDDAQVRV